MIIYRCHARYAALTALLLGLTMNAIVSNAATPEEQIKELQSQISILQQQIQLANLQQTQTSATQTAILTALKAQVSAQSDLNKAKAQSEFATLAGIKAGLDSVGAPLGKEGAITVTTGTAGALMLSLREPMLRGLATAASSIADSTKKATGGAGGVYVGTDAQVQSALQATVTEEALSQALRSLEKSEGDVRAKLGKPVGPAAVAEIAGVGLFLNTLVGLEKFFRVDTTYSIFDGGDEAQQTLMSMLQRKLKDAGVDYRNLSTVSIPSVQSHAQAAQGILVALRGRHDQATAVATEADKLKADDPKRPAQDPKRPAQDLIDRLKADIGVVKALLDGLHPALKPEGFWSYVQGLSVRSLMQDSGKKYLPRLVVSAKAQTIQVLEKRTWRSDKIFGKSDMQVEFRVLDSAGKLIDSGISLHTFAAGDTSGGDSLFAFPTTP
jgi:hypothetical protein